MVLENIPVVAEYSYAAGFATILGIAWSKTSFGITILRISAGWMRWLTLFIIISMNLVMVANAIMLYAQCTPVRRLFDELAEGTCWPKVIGERYQTFCAGKLSFVEALQMRKRAQLTSCQFIPDLGILCLRCCLGKLSGKQNSSKERKLV